MSKYNAKKVTIDGITFDSILESRYFTFLKEQKKNKKIKDFELQPVFILQESCIYQGKKIRPITYKADFLVIYHDGFKKVVDVKGFETTDFKLKKKMFYYNYPDLLLQCVTYVKKRGGWISLEENERLKKQEKQKK